MSAQGNPSTSAESGSNGSRSLPTRPGEDFGLTGISRRPDPATHAYRKDLADTALAGTVIASHYAEPLARHLVEAATFHLAADESSAIIASLEAGAELRMLDNSRGWAWGYGPDGRVGYVRSSAVGI